MKKKKVITNEKQNRIEKIIKRAKEGNKLTPEQLLTSNVNLPLALMNAERCIDYDVFFSLFVNKYISTN